MNTDEFCTLDLTQRPARPDLGLIKRAARQIRRDIVSMLAEAGSGHPGGSLSSADIVAALYCYALRHNPADPEWLGRDRFVLSKGHCCPVLYAALALRGYFGREELPRLRKMNSILQGHPASAKCPGVEVSAGSLGQGLSVGLGMALAAKINGNDQHVFVLLGDGETEEGQIWEAAMAAAHYAAHNLVAILDNNELQIDGPVREVMDIHPIAEKWHAFGWRVVGPVDGHDADAVCAAYDEALTPSAKPTICLMRTIKGKGVSFMEDQVGWHGKVPGAEELATAMAELADYGNGFDYESPEGTAKDFVVFVACRHFRDLLDFLDLPQDEENTNDQRS